MDQKCSQVADPGAIQEAMEVSRLQKLVKMKLGSDLVEYQWTRTAPNLKSGVEEWQHVP